MSNGVFGTIRPAEIDYNDIEIFYHYKPTRSTTDEDFLNFETLSPDECLIPCSSGNDGNSKRIKGVYTLRLPVDKFNQKGIYSVYIRPKELEVTIVDVSVLSAYPDVKGIVLNKVNSSLAGLNDLTGYRIDYESGISRLITSCNYCEPVIVNNGDSFPKTTRYQLTDDSSSYVFCTVTPSVANSFSSNISPYIGTPGESITISNTKFSPQMLEVEMVEHDIDTISYNLEGDQVRDRDNGILTIYNDDKEIYQQYDYYTIKNKLGNPLYDVKQKRKTVDDTQSYDNVIGE